VSRTVLIVGRDLARPDPHVDAVASALARAGARTLLFDHVRPEDSSRLSYSFEGKGCRAVLCVGGTCCDLAEVDAVWWRVKPPTRADVAGQPLTVTADFAEREWRAILDSFETFTARALWVNPRSGDLRARTKPTQLLIARDLGLAIPPTLISNDATAVVEFLAHPEEHVYKVLTWYYAPPDRMIFTSAVTAEQASSDLAAIAVAPGIFQVRIPKAYEVRATVVGDEVFGVRIDSQAREDTKLDWRRDQHAICYRRHVLPSDVEGRLRAMNRRLGIAFGAYDMIVTPDDEYVFLEVNPLGQWLWLERATGLPISDALASLLLG
jgi:glutathione synthase/RimK-type ligase-like ATP-grasp enzyme